MRDLECGTKGFRRNRQVFLFLQRSETRRQDISRCASPQNRKAPSRLGRGETSIQQPSRPHFLQDVPCSIIVSLFRLVHLVLQFRHVCVDSLHCSL